MNTFKNCNALVLGLGKTGFSLVRYLAKRGAAVTVADTRDKPPYLEKLQQEFPAVEFHGGAFRDGDFKNVALIAISPGVAKDQPLIQQAVASGATLVGDVELFAQALPENQKVLGITGSNGKTTTTALTTALCEAAGLSAVAAGNIGEPVLDELEQFENGNFPDVLVLELSSFQLETTSSLKLAAAAVLNVSQNHLDRYKDLDDYAQAKSRIFLNAKMQVLNADDDYSRSMRLPNLPVMYFGEDGGRISTVSALSKWTLLNKDGKDYLVRDGDILLAADELKLNGRHNAFDALAALALGAAAADHLAEKGVPEKVLECLKRFEGLPHRMQFAGECDGVKYINDSKATTVVASQAGMSGLKEPVILILGGDGKKQDFTPIAETVSEHCKEVLLIGRDAPIIEEALKKIPSIVFKNCGTLAAAMETAKQDAQPGDAVLLSPACASWDQFPNYQARGKAFMDTVKGWGV
jgi:UDP-N-acetylmuramoylalanine--D-glutamate ligase